MINLRPETLDEFIGQKDIIRQLKIIIKSSQLRNDICGHIAISGFAGGGKTTLAQAIANELETTIEFANGASTRTIKDLLPFLMRIEKYTVLFIDEVHRLTKITEEYLYTVMEDNYCTIGTEEKVVRMKIPSFTMIGATTEFGLLSKPFRDRFKHHLTLSLYKEDELLELCFINADKLEITVSKDAAVDIVKRSRGVPRVLNKNLEWCRDCALVKKQQIDKDLVKFAMNLAKIDENGLTEDDSKYILYLKNVGQPVGLNTISSGTNISESTIKDVIEPFLISRGLIMKTPKGRILCVKK